MLKYLGYTFVRHDMLFYRYQESFHGINLTSLRDAAVEEYFKQPIVVSGGLNYAFWIFSFWKVPEEHTG